MMCSDNPASNGHRQQAMMQDRAAAKSVGVVFYTVAGMQAGIISGPFSAIHEPGLRAGFFV
jgi:hypothetical protein